MPTPSALLALALATPAAALEQHPLRDPAVLRGARAELEFVVEAPDPDTLVGPLRLELPWTVGEQVSQARSWLHVEVDGVPLASPRLAQLAQRGTPAPWTVPLPTLDAGFHLVRIRSGLAIDDDPCLLRAPEAAWLTVSPDTRVFGVQRKRRVRDAARLADLPDIWQGEDVRIEIDGALDAPRAAAFLEADRVVHALGATSVLDGTGPALKLRAEGPHPRPVEALFEATPAARTALDRVGDDLVVYARTAADLKGGVRAFGDETLRARCTELPCPLGAPPPLPDTVRTETAPHDLPDLGLPRGWVAEGAGDHMLALQWRRPATWKVETAPVLALDVVLPTAEVLDPARSRLTVWLGDRPLETWPLDAGGRHRLTVPLPEDAMTDEVWPVRIGARLTPPGDPEACTWTDDEGPWLRVEPTTRLDVTREEVVPGGLASAAALSAEIGAQVAYDFLLDLPSWHSVAASVRGLPVAAEMLPPGAPCTGVCVRPLRAGTGGTLPREARLDLVPGGRWHDPTGEEALPLLPATPRPLVHAEHCEDGPCRGIVVFVPDPPGTPPDPPPFAALGHRTALWTGERWVGVGEPADPLARTAVAFDPEAQGDLRNQTERFVANTDRVFLALILAVLGLGAVWVLHTSRRRKGGPTGIEIEVS